MSCFASGAVKILKEARTGLIEHFDLEFPALAAAITTAGAAGAAEAAARDPKSAAEYEVRYAH